MSDLSLTNKYRPAVWEEVVGNERAVNALRRVLKDASALPHTYLFTGPSGIGKTTIARIIANELKCEIAEIDAASNNGVDAARALVEFGEHMAMTGTGRRMIIIDECHTLSKPAWQALLKIMEEPPKHLFFALCTTELDKIGETTRTRCYHCVLKPLSREEIHDLIDAVVACEKYKVAEEILQLVIQESTGQPRKALALLQVVHDAPNKDEARRIISIQEASDPLKELLQHLVSGKKEWKIIKGLLVLIREQDGFDEAALQAGGYMTAVLLNQDDPKRAASVWQLLEALVFPSATYDKKTAFIAAVGRMLWGG